MQEFKYPLGTVVNYNLNPYRVVGHTRMIDGHRTYRVTVWAPGTAGYSLLDFDAHEFEAIKPHSIVTPLDT